MPTIPAPVKTYGRAVLTYVLAAFIADGAAL